MSQGRYPDFEFQLIRERQEKLAQEAAQERAVRTARQEQSLPPGGVSLLWQWVKCLFVRGSSAGGPARPEISKQVSDR